MLELRNLAAGYGGHRVISSVSLRCAPGTITAIIGPNGCGKTTLLRSIMGRTECLEGGVWWNERLHAARVARMLPQRAQTFLGLTVGEHLAVAGDSEVAGEVIKLLHAPLLGRRGVKLAMLSGGERQVVALATVLSSPGHILLLDEPLQFLGRAPASGFLQVLRDFTTRRSLVTILVEHRIRAVAQHVDQVVAMRRGEIAWVDSGTPECESKKYADLFSFGA